jgi:glucokinase
LSAFEAKTAAMQTDTGGPSALVADIGGTTSRFALVDAAGRTDHVAIIANDSVDSLQTALGDFLRTLPVKPLHAVLAVAAPVAAGEVALTNRNWRFLADDLRAQFGFRRLRVVNDFEALAWGVPSFAADDVRALTAAPPRDGTKVAIGPGTGLGIAAIARTGADYQVFPSEGGHVSFGPAAADETLLFDAVRTELGYVSAEALLSGAGLVRIYRVMAPGAPPRTTREIAAAAAAGDAAAVATAAMFSRLLGRFAGDAALVFKATGGVYIAGGVARALGDFLGDEFRHAYQEHPPYQHLLADIPVFLITRKEPGLLGSAAIAQRLLADTTVL